MALGIVLLFLGVYGVWDGATHVGPGVWTRERGGHAVQRFVSPPCQNLTKTQ